MFHERLPFNYEDYPATRLDTIYDGVTVFTRGSALDAHQDAVREVCGLVEEAGTRVLTIDRTVETRKGHWTLLHVFGVETSQAA